MSWNAKLDDAFKWSFSTEEKMGVYLELGFAVHFTEPAQLSFEIYTDNH